MRQLSIDVPEVFSIEDVEVGKINTDEQSESTYRNIFKSISMVRRIMHDVILIKLGDGTYRVTCGCRRVLAAKKAGLEKIKAQVFPEGTPPEVLAVFVLLENMNRAPNPAAEAKAISTVMSAYNWEPRDVSDKLGIPLPHVRSRIKILSLIPELFQYLEEGKLTLSAAIKICKLSPEKQHEIMAEGNIKLDHVGDVLKGMRLGDFLPAELFIDSKAGRTAKALVTEAKKLLGEALPLVISSDKQRIEKALKLLGGGNLCSPKALQACEEDAG